MPSDGIRDDALAIVGASVEQLFQPEVWNASVATSDCLNGVLQRLLTLVILRPSHMWFPASWRYRGEFTELYRTRLERVLWDLSNRTAVAFRA
jgi:hypothetical protein